MNEYIILNKTEIEALLVDLGNKIIRKTNKYYSSTSKAEIEIKMSAYREVLLKSIPLNPVLEETFIESRQFNSLDGVVDIDVVACLYAKDLEPAHTNFEEYLTTLTLPI